MRIGIGCFLALATTALACRSLAQPVKSEGGPDFEVDPKSAPEITRAALTGTMYRAVGLVLEFREGTQKSLLSKGELNPDEFYFKLAYASEPGRDSATYIRVVMRPLAYDIIGSRLVQGDRRQASYLVSLKQQRVVCWSMLGGELRGFDEKPCPKFELLPKREPYVKSAPPGFDMGSESNER